MPDCLDRPVIAFDIETIPDPDLARRLLGLEGSDRDVVHEAVRLRLEETQGKSEYPQLPWHRIVCACATVLDPKTGHVEIRELGGAPLDERSHVSGFFSGVNASPRLVSWNGAGFDLPVLRYRAMLLGVAAPDFYRNDPERRENGYEARYHDLHVDLMDVLSGWGASSRVGLNALAQVMGLPGKRFIERAIYDHILDGEGARVVEYCKLDTTLTMLLFLLWTHHRGLSTPAELQRNVAGVRSAIAQLPYEGWREIEAALVSWPRFLS